MIVMETFNGSTNQTATSEWCSTCETLCCRRIRNRNAFFTVVIPKADEHNGFIFIYVTASMWEVGLSQVQVLIETHHIPIQNVQLAATAVPMNHIHIHLQHHESHRDQYCCWEHHVSIQSQIRMEQSIPTWIMHLHSRSDSISISLSSMTKSAWLMTKFAFSKSDSHNPSLPCAFVMMTTELSLICLAIYVIVTKLPDDSGSKAVLSVSSNNAIVILGRIGRVQRWWLSTRWRRFHVNIRTTNISNIISFNSNVVTIDRASSTGTMCPMMH